MNDNNQPLNLEDIAKKAGVSRSTVSRVINDEPYVSEATRTKVMAVIEREGFSPNPAARMLVTRSTNVIGIVIPHTLKVVFEDPYYFPSLLYGMSQIAHQRDYATLLWWGSPDEEEQLYQRILRNRLMDGLIIASAWINDPLVPRLVALKIPFVLLERPTRYVNQSNYVGIDNVQAAQTAVNHLLNLGRQRIGTITGGEQYNADAQDRLTGYKKALQLAGIRVDETLIYQGDFTRRSGYLGIRKLMQAGVDAVFAASDIMALGAMDALQEMRLKVPDDVAIVGFDDLPNATNANPPLTTLRQPVELKGATAAELLLDLLAGKAQTPTQILLPTQLVIRESCGVKNRERS